MQEIGNKYTRALFTLTNDKFKSYWEFELTTILSGSSDIYTSAIRVEKQRGFNSSKDIHYWLVIQDNDTWSRCTRLTGLRSIKKMRAYYGDQKEPFVKSPKGKPKSLIILQFAQDNKSLVVDYFPMYYPYSNETRTKIFDTHKYYFQ